MLHFEIYTNHPIYCLRKIALYKVLWKNLSCSKKTSLSAFHEYITYEKLGALKYTLLSQTF